MDNSLIEVKCQLESEDFNIDDVVRTLPECRTIITQAKIVGQQFRALEVELLVAATTVEEALQWVEDYMEKTRTTYKIRSTEKRLGLYVTFKQRRCCHHNTSCKRVHNSAAKSRTKNTNCPSKMTITLRNVQHHHPNVNNKQPNPELPCEICMVVTHNHDLDADMLKFRPVSNEVKQRLIGLYSKGYTPAQALGILKNALSLDKQNCENILTDRKYCPDYRYCHYIHKEFLKGRFGKPPSVTETVEVEDSTTQLIDEVIVIENAVFNGNIIIIENANNVELVHENAECTPKSLVDKCKSVMDEFVCILTPFLEQSPQQVLPALENLKKRALSFESTSAVASSFLAFGSKA